LSPTEARGTRRNRANRATRLPFRRTDQLLWQFKPRVEFRYRQAWTVPKMNAVFGWKRGKMAGHYIEQADRIRLAAGSARLNKEPEAVNARCSMIRSIDRGMAIGFSVSRTELEHLFPHLVQGGRTGTKDPAENNPVLGRWCPGKDSNLHGLHRWYLKPVRLPIPPPGHGPRFFKRAGWLMSTARHVPCRLSMTIALAPR
jgi:hypothetical protein